MTLKFFPDVINIKPLSTLTGRNFAGAQSETEIACGLLHFEQPYGRQVADLCLKEISENFETKDWSANGPKLITRVTASFCGTDSVKKMIEENQCQFNFTVLPVKTCYAVFYDNHKMFFEEQALDEVMSRLSDSIVVHVWNALSAHIALTRNSNVSYVNLAKKYCPKTIAASEVF